MVYIYNPIRSSQKGTTSGPMGKPDRQSPDSVPDQASFGFISITRMAKRIRAAGPCVVVVGGGSDGGRTAAS